MRPNRKPAVIHAMDERALVDERPAVRRPYRAACFLLAACFAAGTAWYARDSAAQRKRIDGLEGKVRNLRRVLDMISDPKAREHGGGQENQEERR